MNSNTCSQSTSVLAEDSENSNLTGDFSIKAARNKRKSVGKENEPTKKTTKKTDQAKEIKSNYSIVTYLKVIDPIINTPRMNCSNLVACVNPRKTTVRFYTTFKCTDLLKLIKHEFFLLQWELTGYY